MVILLGRWRVINCLSVLHAARAAVDRWKHMQVEMTRIPSSLVWSKKIPGCSGFLHAVWGALRCRHTVSLRAVRAATAGSTAFEASRAGQPLSDQL